MSNCLIFFHVGFVIDLATVPPQRCGEVDYFLVVFFHCFVACLAWLRVRLHGASPLSRCFVPDLDFG